MLTTIIYIAQLVFQPREFWHIEETGPKRDGKGDMEGEVKLTSSIGLRSCPVQGQLLDHLLFHRLEHLVYDHGGLHVVHGAGHLPVHSGSI